MSIPTTVVPVDPLLVPVAVRNDAEAIAQRAGRWFAIEHDGGGMLYAFATGMGDALQFSLWNSVGPSGVWTYATLHDGIRTAILNIPRKETDERHDRDTAAP